MIFGQVSDDRKVRVFSLSTSFLEPFRDQPPAWGYAGLGLFTFKRTYSRLKPDGLSEDWWETCQRVVEGCFNIQKIHCRQMGLPWNEPKAQKCLPEGTGVHLVNGMVPIEQVRVGDKVQTTHGVAEVINIWDRGEQETIQLVTPFGVLECTANHQVAVFRDNLFTWEFIKAGDIVEGDRLVFDAHGYEGGYTELPRSSEVNVPALTPEIAWLIGAVHGDGSVQVPVRGRVNGIVRLRIEHNRPRLADALQRVVGGLGAFGHEPKVYENETMEVKLFSGAVASYFHQHVKQANSPLEVPRWIWAASRDVRSAYLAGLFDADGCCKSRPLVLVTTVYENFARQIRDLYGTLGIASYVVMVGVGPRSPRPRYSVCTKGFENTGRFQGGIGRFSTKLVPRKQERTSKKTHSFPISAVRATFGGWDGENKDLATYRISQEKGVSFHALPVEVTRIDPGRVVRTHDIEVEGLRQFTVAGGFVVHNSAQEMFQRLWEFKWTPPGRGLWMMGTDLVYERGSASLQNCAFVSSEGLAEDFAAPFCFLMDMSMLGVGVGGDTRGAGKVKIQMPKTVPEPYVVADSREGWVDLLRVVLNSFVGKGAYPLTIDYSKVRGRGVPLKTFGGTASGPGPLQEMVAGATKVLLPDGVKVRFDITADQEKGTIDKVIVQFKGESEPAKLTSTQIVDLFNYIGKCVVAGGIRRSSEIMFGESTDQEFLKLKQDKKALADRRWASNNSIFGYAGMDYGPLVEAVSVNGEPGVFWIENARKFSRMQGPGDNKDWRVMGSNPCFSGDTLIAVADGRGAVPIRQLAEEGRDVSVYSINKEGRVEIKWGRNPRLTRETASLIEVVFDDETSLKVTPDHKMCLLDGTQCEAKDLQVGDSLPRFTKRLEVFTRGKAYLRVYGDTLDTSRGKVFEHRLIARFHDPEGWNSIYDGARQSGWVKGGLVVHHKDFNPLNNSPGNLKIMTFREHQLLHARLADTSCEKNGMWGKRHTEDTRRMIGAKAKMRCLDPAFLQKLSEAQTSALRAEAAQRMSVAQRSRLFTYYKEQETGTDLETLWLNDRLYAVKGCEVCGEEMVLPWRVREQSYCSRSCHNKEAAFTKKRLAGQALVFTDRQRQVLHEQVSVFKTLEAVLSRIPQKIEWEAVCRDQGVPTRFRTAGTTANPHALTGYKQLQEVSASYNHRVKEVRFFGVGMPVYNITVEDNHTVGVVTNFDPSTKVCDGVFSFQCGEMSLESYESCNLTETYPARHDSYEDFERTLKMAYLYAKTVTLVPTHDMRANAVMTRNRRIGCSMSGIIQAMVKLGRRQFFQWCDQGYGYLQRLDRVYSDWLGIPLSIKVSTVKPSGTVSLLMGATPGIHYPHAPHYIRHVRVANTSALVDLARKAGHPVYDDPYAPDTSVVGFPIKEEHYLKGKGEVTVWEQFVNAVDMQRRWADNQVSVTVTFRPEEAQDLRACLETFEDRLKGVSLLPAKEGEGSSYLYPPYLQIDEVVYKDMMARIKPMSLTESSHDVDDNLCSGDKCLIG